MLGGSERPVRAQENSDVSGVIALECRDQVFHQLLQSPGFDGPNFACLVQAQPRLVLKLHWKNRRDRRKIMLISSISSYLGRLALGISKDLLVPSAGKKKQDVRQQASDIYKQAAKLF